MLLHTRHPINEFTANADFFLNGFAHLFLLGQGLPSDQGSLSDTVMRHLLLQFDGRFARCFALLFAMFNQKQRHAVVRSAAVRIKSGSVMANKFIELANDVDFRSRLDRAVVDSKTPKARNVMAIVTR